MKMKTIILAIALALGSQTVIAEEPKTRTICVDVKDKEGKPVKDAKTGKTKQSCKEVKVHKKLDGTKVPDKK